MEPLISRWWGALLCYLFLSGVVLYPASTMPFTYIAGHEQATAGCHVWVLWWAQQGLSHIETDLIFYPYGGDVMKLYGSDVLSPLLLSWIPLSPVFLYNIWVWFLLVFGSMGLRSLALFEKSSDSGSFVGGVCFLSAPFLLHELLNGTSEILACAFVPWFVLYLKRVLQDGGYRNSMCLGVLAGLSVMSSVYNAFFLLLVTLIIFISKLIMSREPVWTWTRLYGLSFSFLCAMPFFSLVAWLQLGHGAKETASRREDWMSKELLLPDSFASLDDWFDPTAVELPAVLPLPDGSTFEYWTLCTVYVGWIVLFCTIRSLWKKIDMYAWGALFAACIAMGPYVRWDGALVGDGIGLPLSTLAYLFPPLSIVALHAYRFSAIVVLCTAICVSRGVFRYWWGLFIVLEALLWSPVPYPAQVTAAQESEPLQLLQNAPEGAVLAAPLAVENLHDLSQALVAQTQHTKPIQDGGIHRRIGGDAIQLFTENALVSAMSHRDGPVLLEKEIADEAVRELCTIGYRYFLLRRGEEELEIWTEKWLGSPNAQGEMWSWWSFPHCETKEKP